MMGFPLTTRLLEGVRAYSASVVSSQQGIWAMLLWGLRVFTEALAAYVKNIEDEPVVIVHCGFALAALVPLGNMDYENIELANNPRFLAILEESRAIYEREGGIPSEEVKKMFEDNKDN